MFYDKPIFFEKNRVFRVYKGGFLFSQFLGDDSADGNYPEEWIASSVKALNKDSQNELEGVSKIEGEGLYLSEALLRYKNELLGGQDNMRILTKFLDSAIRLPIQAHPDKAFSQKYFQSEFGKEECWVVLATRPGAKIYFGFREGITREIFMDAVEKSEYDKKIMENLLREYPVNAGDVIFIPAKVVHAIGYGCLILEVQEPTDFTIQPERYCDDYRLSDYEMYLGLDKETAVSCFDFSYSGYPFVQAKNVIDEMGIVCDELVGPDITGNFCVRRIQISDSRLSLGQAPAVYIVVGGEGILIGDSYERGLKKGDYFFLSDRAKNKYQVKANSIKMIQSF